MVSKQTREGHDVAGRVSGNRLAELRAQIGAARSAEIDAIAATPTYQRPILDKLLLGEKLDFATLKKRKQP